MLCAVCFSLRKFRWAGLFQIWVQKLNQRTHFKFFPNFLSNVHQKGGSFLIFGVATNHSFNSPFDGWLFCFRPNWVCGQREHLSCGFRHRSVLFLFSDVRKSTFRSARCSLVFHQFYCQISQPVSTRFCSIVLLTKFLRPAPKTYCGRQLRITFCSYPKVAISKHFTVNQAQTLIEAQSLI